MIDALHDGAKEVNNVAETVQEKLMERLGISDLLYPSTIK